MGNKVTSSNSPPLTHRRKAETVYISNNSKSNRTVNSTNFNLSDFVASCSLHSFGSLQSHNSRTSSCSLNRPWSRVSRRQWQEKTLSSPLEAAKTAWPVPFTESLFLPTFRIRDDVTEESFEIIEAISTGAFGSVAKVQKRDDGRIYAMKVLSKAQIISAGAVQQVKDEVRIQQACGHHPLIVNCPFFWQSRKQLYIVSDYVPGGELLRLLQIRGTLPEATVRIYIAQLASALDFLHNAGVIYRDLKLENILLDARGRVQLVDFGLAKWLKYGSRTNTLCGTMQYIAPEVLLGEAYGHAVDWWSLGIVLACMLLGHMPFPRCLDDNDEIRSVPIVSASKEATELVHLLLDANPTKRLHSVRALERIAFFQNFNIPAATNTPVDLSDS